MVKVDAYARIRRAHRVDQMSIRELSRRFHHSRRKIREILAQPEPKPYRRRALPSVVDPFKPVIDAILRADEIIYDPNTGDIETRGQVTICTSGTIGPNGPCL